MGPASHGPYHRRGYPPTPFRGRRPPADPGRPPFHALSEKVVKKLGGEVKEWAIDGEVEAEAYLLIAGSLPQEDSPRV